MKQVSNAYKLSMKSLLREQSFVEITFSQVDTAAATDGNWVSNGAQSYSEFDTLDYGYDYQESYAALELNRWALDGNTVIVPSSGTMYDGFVSSHMSNAEGKFTTPAVLTRAFSNPHTFPGITLTFDTRYQEWPDTVTVDFFLNGAVLESLTLPVEGTELVINTKVASCDKIVLTMGNTLPYRRPRLQQVLYGVQKKFGNDDVVSIKESHDVDPLSRRLPQETMQFVLLDYEHNYDPDNPKGIYAYLDKKSPIALRYGYMLPTGKVEWLKADKYVLNSKPKAAKNQATFTGTGLVGSLTGTFYKSKLGSKNFYDMAEEVLLDADLTLTAQGTHPWVIDPTLKQMFTTAALPIDSHMNCLQLIAHACRCRLFTDDDNIIHIKPFGVTVVGIYSGVWADNGHLWYSEWDTVDRGNKVGNTYAALELNRWTLDGGDQVIVEGTDPSGRGFISEAMTAADGTYTTKPTFTKTFDVSHDLPVLALRFDTPLDEYPTSIQVKYYAGTKLLDTQTVKGITSAEVFVNSEAAIDCTKIEVTMDGGLPYRRMLPNMIDHYFKEVCRIKAYERYMDDGVAISPDIDDLYLCMDGLKIICEKCGLELNLKKTRVIPLRDYYRWLKTRFIITPIGKVVRKMNKDSTKIVRHKLRAFRGKLDRGEMTLADIRCSVDSYNGHMKRGHSFKVRQRTNQYFKSLYGFYPDEKGWKSHV